MGGQKPPAWKAKITAPDLGRDCPGPAAITLATASLGRDRPCGWPIRIAQALEIHLEEPGWFLARQDPVPNFPPSPVLDHRRVTDCHWPGGNLPNVAVGRRLECKIAHSPHRVRVQDIAFLLGAIGKDCECVEADLAVGAITPPLDYLDRPIQERANP